MSIKKSGKPIDEQLRDVKNVMRSLPTYVGTQAVNFSKRSFKRQGFVDERFKKWPSRKRKQKGRKRSVLVKSGALRRGIRIVKKEPNAVTIGNNLPYARVHNEGFKGSQRIRAHKRNVSKAFGRKLKQPVTANVKAHNRKMNTPQRKFMGKSQFFAKRIEKNIAHKLNRAINGN